LADRELDLDRIDRRDRRQHGRRSDEVADLREVDARDPVDRRENLRPLEVEARLLERRLRLLDRRAVREDLLDRVVELLLADGDLCGERPVARDVLLGLLELRLRLAEVSDRLVVRGLELTRIDLEEELARLDDAAVRIVLGQQVALDLRTDLRVDV